jgi:hypothetical protein
MNRIKFYDLMQFVNFDTAVDILDWKTKTIVYTITRGTPRAKTEEYDDKLVCSITSIDEKKIEVGVQ